MDLKERRNKKRRMQRRRRDHFRRVMTAFFIVSLVLVTVLNLVIPDRKFSDQENRMLTQKPHLTWAGIESGSFMKEFENYYADQFFARDAWISIKLGLERASGKRESNGVFLGKKGHLLEKPNEPDWDGVQKNMQAVSEFAANHSGLSTTFCMVPNAFSVQSQYLPKDAPVRSQAEDLAKIQSMAGDSVRFVDLTGALKQHASEYIYYKTDHHWTSLGARYGFEALAGTLGIDQPAADYDVYTVAADFQGTLASKSGYHGTNDTVTVYQPKDGAQEYIVEYADTGAKTTSVYSSEALKQKDKYQVFFGGNHTRITISTTVANDKNLLVIKDSFANCFVPFLLPYYQTITIVDPRYYYDSIDTLIENNSITDVLFLYNANTFVQDNSLADVIAPSDK
ncbi:MAG: DHHW family protein [Lachnospiraceae bacterium]|nr:DHHW family protein [Lachnospiraceae bacterium]MCI1329122.1 DHHW family protein [Lachnospiraceae bacterium]